MTLRDWTDPWDAAGVIGRAGLASVSRGNTITLTGVSLRGPACRDAHIHE